MQKAGSGNREQNAPGDLEALKARNEALIREEFARQKTVLQARPMFLQIETTTRCNFRCRICERTYAPVAGADMDHALLDRLEADVFPTLRDSSLQCFGEPLLDPRFDEVVQRMTAHGIHTGFTTNGARMTVERLEGYVRQGLFLCLSLDGATAETYRRIRPQGDFDAIVAVFSQFGALKARYPDAGARLRLHFVATTENIDDLPAMIDLAETMGADEVEVLNFLTTRVPADVAQTNLSADPARANRQFDAARRRAEGSPVRLRLPPPLVEAAPEDYDFSAARNYLLWPKLADSSSPYPNSCSDPWSLLVVSANGDVRTCCVWPYALGNLHRQSFEEIWNGAPFQKVRRRVNSRYPQRACRDCTLWSGVNAGRPEAVRARLPLDCRLFSALQDGAAALRRATRRP